jgi:hypothetical protein
MFKLTALVVACVLPSITACKKDQASPPSSSSSSSPSPGASSSPPPAAKSADPGPAAKASAISLDAAGAAWKGFTLQGPSGATVSDNGAGGAVVNFADNTMVQLTPADDFDVKTFKSILAANAKTVTYTTDTADDLTYVTETDMGGSLIKGYGINVIVSAGGKKATCGSTYDDQATADRIKAICKTLAK